MRKSDLLVVADENMPAVEAMFGHLGTVKRVSGRTISAEDVKDADLLLVRSVSQVNEQLLAGSKVQFVGTATIGTDHIDKAYLASQNIGFSAAPGCNADAVVDYVFASLYQLSAEQGFLLQQRTLGIIGVGNVGGRLRARAEQLGLKLLLNDPPRAEREGGFVELDQVLAQADIICMHTPLTVEGPHATQHLLATAELERLKPGTILLNAGRGPAIDNAALLKVMQTRDDLTLVLDVWELEPVVDPQLAAYCAIATPHIAGYSLDGKIRGTFMLYKAWCQQLGIECDQQLEALLPASPYQQIALTETVEVLDLLRLCYDPYRDDRALRQTLHLPAKERAIAFDKLRKNYPVRRELLTLPLTTTHQTLADELNAVGFVVS